MTLKTKSKRLMNAAIRAVDAYDRLNRMKNTDSHNSDCGCLRCAIESLRAEICQ